MKKIFSFTDTPQKERAESENFFLRGAFFSRAAEIKINPSLLSILARSCSSFASEAPECGSPVNDFAV